MWPVRTLSLPIIQVTHHTSAIRFSIKAQQRRPGREAATPVSVSLIANRLNRIERCGSARRQPAGEQAHQSEQSADRRQQNRI